MISKILLVGFAGFLIAQTSSSANRSKKHQEAATPTTKSEQGVHIEYLCAGQRESIFSDESDNGIWLRLKNSSRRTIFVRTYPRPRAEHPCTRKARSEVGIYYEVVEKESYSSVEKEITELPIGYRTAGFYTVIKLKPHSSIVFSVAREHLMPRRAIYITFWYARNKPVQTKEKSEELRRAYFYAFELPDTKKK